MSNHFRMANRNNFLTTMVRNLGKHDSKFLEEKILVEKEFSQGYPDRMSMLRVVQDAYNCSGNYG